MNIAQIIPREESLPRPKKRTDNVVELPLPLQREHAGLYAEIQAFSMDEPGARFTFAARLARDNRWTEAFAERVIREYKRFMLLAVAAGHTVTPSDQVDQAWHLHLTYTRSYWDGFCARVLRKPVHHGPTTGGPAERSKFLLWYTNTLDSYQKTFDESPPADIWPAPSIRFGEDLHFVRVNTHNTWLLSKPSKCRIALALTLMPLPLLMGAAGAQGESEGSGWGFLLWLLCVGAVALFGGGGSLFGGGGSLSSGDGDSDGGGGCGGCG